MKRSGEKRGLEGHGRARGGGSLPRAGRSFAYVLRTPLRMTDVLGPGQRRGHRHEAGAFTLVELVLVMTLLVVLLATVAPSLGRSLRQRNLDQQATRLLALTEYARDEARSQGVPMAVWINPDEGRYGINPQPGYPGNDGRAKEYRLPADLSFDPVAGAVPSKTPGHGFDVAEFYPSGNLNPNSVAAVRLSGHGGADAEGIAQTADGYGYQIVKNPEGAGR